jgi:hypothetical protein
MGNNRARTIVLLILALVIVVSGIAAYRYINRFQYNADTAAGNTAGNLNNGGLFCEYDGKIYFSNPYDNGKLYKMDSDCSNAVKVSDDTAAYINVHGNYIYYVRNNMTSERLATLFSGYLNGINRCNLNGSHAVSLYNDASGALSMCGNYLYYQHYDKNNDPALTLYRMGIDGTDDTLVSKDSYTPSSYYNGKLYVCNIGSDHGIYSMDVSTGSMTKILDVNSYMVDMEGQYIYYIDQDNNYSLMRYNSSNKVTEKLIDGKCVHYNLYGSKVFAMVEGDDVNGIYRMNVDGSQKELIAEGDFTNISCTSQYTFFQYYNDKITLYRVPTQGTITSIEQILVK